MKKIVYIVHSVDTEGHYMRVLKAKFDRLYDVFNLKLSPKKNILEKLKNKKINLNGKEDAVSTLLSNHLTNYNDNWKKIDKMIKNIFLKISEIMTKTYLVEAGFLIGIVLIMLVINLIPVREHLVIIKYMITTQKYFKNIKTIRIKYIGIFILCQLIMMLIGVQHHM